MKIIFKIHFLFFISAFICMVTGLFKDFVMISSIILIHELGHITCAYFFRWQFVKVVIFPFGGLTIFNQKINSSLKEEFLIALAGPLFQILFYQLVGNGNRLFTDYHYFILFFNLLPIYPLDGAKLMNIIFNKFFSFKHSYFLTIIFSLMSAGFIFLLLAHRRFNLIMLFSILLLITKVFQYYQQLEITFHKFLFERYLYKIKYKKIKKIKGLKLNRMFKGKTHEFIVSKNAIKEEEILAKMFDTKHNL